MNRPAKPIWIGFKTPAATMNRTEMRFAAITMALCVAIAILPSHAENWPQWRGPHRDGKSSETGLLGEWPAEGPPLLWRAENVGEGHASLAVVDGFVFTTGLVTETGEGVLSALDPTGDIVWQTPYGPEWTGMYPGARSCPTIDGDNGYILSGTARLVCFDPKTGAVRWGKNVAEAFAGLQPRVGFAESPLVVGNRVICTPGGANAGVVALDKNSGATVWTTEGFSDQSAYCSAVLLELTGTRLVVTVTARNLVGIDAETGAVMWREPFDTEAEDPNHSVSPVFEYGRIYITSGHRDGGREFELSADGKRLTPGWTDTILNCLHGGLIALEGYVYGASTKGRWVCLDLRNGAVTYETRGVGMGSVIYADGMLYCYGEKGTLGLVTATPTEYRLVSSVEIPGGAGPHWAHPAISDGRLYVRHGTAVMAFDIRHR